MQFITVNYALNQTYQVEESAFKNAVESAVEELKNISIVHLEIDLIPSRKNVLVSIEVESKIEEPVSKIMAKVGQAVSDAIYNLIDEKPTNIEITIKG